MIEATSLTKRYGDLEALDNAGSILGQGIGSAVFYGRTRRRRCLALSSSAKRARRNAVWAP